MFKEIAELHYIDTEERIREVRVSDQKRDREGGRTYLGNSYKVPQRTLTLSFLKFFHIFVFLLLLSNLAMVKSHVRNTSTHIQLILNRLVEIVLKAKGVKQISKVASEQSQRI